MFVSEGTVHGEMSLSLDASSIQASHTEIVSMVPIVEEGLGMVWIESVRGTSPGLPHKWKIRISLMKRLDFISSCVYERDEMLNTQERL